MMKSGTFGATIVGMIHGVIGTSAIAMANIPAARRRGTATSRSASQASATSTPTTPTTTSVSRVGWSSSSTGTCPLLISAHGPGMPRSLPPITTSGPMPAITKTPPVIVATRATAERRHSSTAATSTTSTSGQPNQVFCSVCPIVFSTYSSPARVSRANVTYAARSSPQLWNSNGSPR